MRILELYGQEFARLRGKALIEAILSSEGRTLIAEVEGISSSAPYGYDRHANGAEYSAAFGADLIIVNNATPSLPGPVIPGIDDLSPVPEGFGGLARFLGRPCAPILEPNISIVPDKMRANRQNGIAAEASGANFAVLTANPNRGRISHKDIFMSISSFREGTDMVLFAGKMHHSGCVEDFSPSIAKQYIQAGADGVIIPVPGTVPGLTEDAAQAFAYAAHEEGGIVLSSITTSQEGSDIETIRRLALSAKRIGADVHHISTAGYPFGSPPPENLYAYSVAIRGIRHTWNRMSRNLRNHWGNSSYVN